MEQYVILIRIFVAMILGGVIGLERSFTRHNAGLRTHILVCVGSATIMVLSESLADKYGIHSEIMRMGAQVVSGIGFLGAGSMIISGSRVKGITTAAGIWATSSVGLAVGCGFYQIAITTVVLMLVAMLGLRSFAKRLEESSESYILRIDIEAQELAMGIINKLNTMGVRIINFKSESSAEAVEVVFEIALLGKDNINGVIDELSRLEGVKYFKEFHKSSGV